MARIYANLIERGAKTLESVPLKLRDEVEQILIKDGYIKSSKESIGE